MAPTYDDQNIFAKILRGEIPCDKVDENEHALAFRDISPRAPTHVLVIPKGAYIDFEDFAANASAEEQAGFMALSAQVVKSEKVGMASGGQGFRAITNAGPDGVQEVPHFHMHIIGGKRLGAILPSS